MTLAATELCLRAAAVTLLLVLAASMFADFRNVLAGRLVIAFALGAAAHAVTASIGAGEPISVWHAPLIALATGDMVVFWLFTRALFDDGFVLRWWHGLIWAAVVVFSFVNCMWIAPRGHAQAAITTVNLLGLVFIALAVAQTVGSWSADLVERRRRVRVFIVVASALYGGMNALLQIAYAGSRVTVEWANLLNAGVGAPHRAKPRIDNYDANPWALDQSATNPGGSATRARLPEQQPVMTSA